MLCLRGVFAVTVAIVLVGLTPIARANPPDHTWIAGFWDDGDFDNVVDFITDVSALSAHLVITAAPLRASDDWVELAQRTAGSTSLHRLASPRAPPVALARDN